MLQHRALVLCALTATLVLTACTGDAGVDDVCAAADMPARTPAEISAVKARVDAVFEKGKPVGASARNKRVLTAAMSVSQSAGHAQFLAEASASGQAALASMLDQELGKGSGFTLTDLGKAQAELRAACRR